MLLKPLSLYPNLSVTQFCLSDNCNRDYVEIHGESAAGPLLGHFCGGAVPSNVTVGNKLWIKFRSDDRGTTGGGFIAEYNLREYKSSLILIRKLSLLV